MEKIESFRAVEGDIRTEVLRSYPELNGGRHCPGCKPKKPYLFQQTVIAFVEEEETPVEGKLTLQEAKIKHRSRVHNPLLSSYRGAGPTSRASQEPSFRAVRRRSDVCKSGRSTNSSNTARPDRPCAADL